MNIDIILICQCVLMGCTLISASHFDGHGRLERIGMECAEEGGIGPGEMKELFREETEEAKRKYACFHACRFRKLEVMDGTNLNGEKLKEALNRHIENDEEKEIMNGRIDKCMEEVKDMTDECDVALAFHKCTSSRPHHRRAAMKIKNDLNSETENE